MRFPHYSVIPSILFSVIPSVAEESRGNEFFLIPRDGGVYCCLGFVPRGLSSAFSTLFCHSERSRGISWKRTRKLFLFLALSKVAEFFASLFYTLALSNVAERGGAPAPERGLLLDFSQKHFNKDKINYQISILYRQTLILRVRHFPRLLGKARPYYLIVPLLNQRFREMKGRRFACST